MSPSENDSTPSEFSASTAAGVALITGASSGIGTDFARELAGRGYDLILAARRLELLNEQRDSLIEEFGTRVDVIRCDLSTTEGTRQLFDEVVESHRLPTLVVNNAGLGHFGPMLEQSVEQLQEMIQVNLVALTALTRWFAEAMVDRGSGRILNHASFSGIQPAPGYAVYSATKAYVLAMSECLNHELQQTDVRISTLCPGFFLSDFLDKAGQAPGFFVKRMLLDRSKVARVGIRGALRGKAVMIPGLQYQALNLLIRLFPRFLTMGTTDLLIKY